MHRNTQWGLVVKKVLKVFLKVFLTLLVLVLGIGAFAGYHIYRGITISQSEIKFGLTEGNAETALNFFKASLVPYEGRSGGPLPSSLHVPSFNVFKYLEVNSVADVSEDPLKVGKFKVGKFNKRYYEKNKLEGKFREKWGDGDVVLEYREIDGAWFNESKTVNVDVGDSTVIFIEDNSYGGRNQLYVSKRENDFLTQSVGCYWNGEKCTDSISVSREEIDPASGKLKMRISKSRGVYYEGVLSLRESMSFAEIPTDTTEYFYDDLNRLVKLKMSDMTYHFIHGTRDTANLDVKIYGTPAVQLAHYQRTRKDDLEVIRIKTRQYETVETKFFEKGILVKSESIEDHFYDNRSFTLRMYDANGNIVKDSSFYEECFLPGSRYNAGAEVRTRTYDEDGKILFVDTKFYGFKRLLPVLLFPLESNGEPMEYVPGLHAEVYEYDSQNRLVEHAENTYQTERVSIEYDVVDSNAQRNYTTCYVPSSIEKIEWNKVSDLFSISPSGKYRKQFECHVADKKLTCDNAYYKWTSDALDKVSSDKEFWEKCFVNQDDDEKDRARKNSGFVSAPLTKDSMVYLNELMLASGIELDSILCEGCQIVGKKGKHGESYSSFTCKLGMELYEFKAADKNILNEVSVFYGNPKGLPDCLVGFAHSSGIVLGMSKHNVGGVKLPFMKTNNEWAHFVDHPMYGGWGDSRNLRLRFTKDKLCNYRATEFID